MPRKVKITLYLTTLLVLVFAGTFIIQRFVGQTIPGVVKTESTVEPREGLVAYWNMDDNDINGSIVYDKSGQGNNGTKTGATGVNNTPQSATGIINQALDFDGTDDEVQISSFDPPHQGTVSMWVKRGSSSASKKRFIGGHDAYEILFNANLLSCDLFAAGSFEVTGSTITDTDWHHIVCTYDFSTNAMVLYLDGIVDGTSSNADDDPGGPFTLTIGNRTGLSEWFDGQIDEVRIYNRVLPQSEITQLYNASKRAKIVNAPPREGLVAYYNMDDESVNGSTLLDKTTVKSNGTINGSTTGVAGKMGQALEFNGTSSDYVNLGTPGELDITDAITVSAWFYPTASGSWDAIAARGHGTASDNTWQLSINSSNKINTRVYTTAQSSTITGPTRAQNEWQHATMSYDGSNLRLYVNGDEVSGSPLSVTGSLSNDTNFIGIGSESANGSPSDYFKGKIDEVYIYNRALSATEVKALYNNRPATVSTSQNSKNVSGLVGLWSFNGQDMDWASTTAEALDRSGNNNNGDVTNFGQSSVRVGKVGQALSFDGTDDNVIIGDSNSVDLTNDGTFSIWMKEDSSVLTRTGYLDKRSGSTGYQWFNSKENGAGVSRLTLVAATDANYNSPSGYMIDDEWHLYTLTFDSTNGVKWYRDGALIGTNAWDHGASAGTGSLYIGYRPSASEYFKGPIDEVRIYNRALSAEEVLELYQGK